jgi:hypothetical protein
MDAKKLVTRRTILGKGVVAGVAALGLGALARPAAIRAKSEKPPTTQSGGVTCEVFCDKNGKNCKRCCYDQYGYPMGCTPVESKKPKTPRR